MEGTGMETKKEGASRGAWIPALLQRLGRLILRTKGTPDVGVACMEGTGMETENESASRVFWIPALLERIVSFMPANDIAGGIRLASKSAAVMFRRPEHTTIRLSLPCPHSTFRRHWCAAGSVRSLSLARRRLLVCITATNGSLANLEVALEAAACSPVEAMLEAALAAGKLEACKWLRDRGCPWGKGALCTAAKAGHQDACEWLLASGCPWNDAAVYAAVRGGHLVLMVWLLQHRLIPDRWGLEAEVLVAAAAEGCSLYMLQCLHGEWLAGRQLPAAASRQRRMAVWWDCPLLSSAVASRTPDWQEKVEWLEGQGYPVRSDSYQAPFQPEHTDRLSWMRERGYPFPCDKPSYEQLCRTGNAAQLRLFHRDAPPQGTGQWRQDGAEIAARAGHVPALEVLFDIGYVGDLWRGDMARIAAAAGHRHVVIWLVEERGYDVSVGNGSWKDHEKLIDAAAQGGDAGLMTWLRERNCPVEGWIAQSAVKGGCEAALDWVVAGGYPPQESDDLFYEAALNGDLGTLRWLKRSLKRRELFKAPLFKRILAAASPLPALRWLAEEACCPVDWQAAASDPSLCDSFWVGREDELDRVRAWIAEASQRQQQEPLEGR